MRRWRRTASAASRSRTLISGSPPRCASSLPCAAKLGGGVPVGGEASPACCSSAGLGCALAICSASRPRTPVVTCVPLVPVRATLNSLRQAARRPAWRRRGAAVAQRQHAAPSLRRRPALTRVQPPLRSSASTAVFSGSVATVAASVAGSCLSSAGADHASRARRAASSGNEQQQSEEFSWLSSSARTTLPAARGL